MAGVDKFGCPNVNCSYIGYSEGECPECGSNLVKPKGDDYQFNPNVDDESPVVQINDEFADDPDNINWYPEGEEGLSVM